MGKKVARHRPAIHDTQKQLRNTGGDLRNCATPGCRNVIARWTNMRFCACCRKTM